MPPSRGRPPTATFLTSARFSLQRIRKSRPVLSCPKFLPAFLHLIVDTEAQQRTMLRLSLDPEPGPRGELPLRQGRAIGWISEALAPLGSRMSKAEVRRLAVAIRSAAGIEALIWLTDIAGLSRRQAVEVMRGSARALLRSALADLDHLGK